LKLDEAILTSLSALPAATVHEAQGQRGAMVHDMRPVYPTARLCGAAVTVSCAPGDNLTIHQALTFCRPGSILVVSMGGHLEGGCFGEILAVAAMERGVAGLVCDGSVRDVARLEELGFPVFSRGVSMKGTSKVKPGAINVPIICGGTWVSPGDAVLGDADGVVVVPAEEVPSVIKAAQAKEDAERGIMERIRAGELTVDILDLPSVAPTQLGEGRNSA